MSGIGSHQKANMITEEWLTPPEIVNDLGPFDLDPCSPVLRPWDTAKFHFTKQQNGLIQPWDGFVWCNPPYGQITGKWLEKMAIHNHGIALVFARTETKMFFKWIFEACSAILFIKGRLTFYTVKGKKATGNAGGPSVLVGYGKVAVERMSNTKIQGKLFIV